MWQEEFLLKYLLRGVYTLAVYCGVDIVEISRIKRSFNAVGAAFRDKVFTGEEIQYCESRKTAKYQSYAARFAAKEAVSKALGTGISSGIAWKDIGILNDGLGKPYVVLSNKAKELLAGIGGTDISISLSHCRSYAVAYAVISTGQ
jgi:holo-[acyl-carrier protein] synthase